MLSASSLFSIIFSLLAYKVIFWSEKEVSFGLIFLLATLSGCISHAVSDDGFSVVFDHTCSVPQSEHAQETMSDIGRRFMFHAFSFASDVKNKFY